MSVSFVFATANALSTRTLSNATLSDRCWFRSSTKNAAGDRLGSKPSGTIREYGKPL